jgi:exoribonuclease R
MSSIVNILKENYKECTIDDTPIDGSIIFKSKLFHNDRCTFINNTFTDITSKRNTFLIGGILKLSNNVFYRENNKYLYEFIPLNWRYPKFMVASEIKTNLIKKKEIVTDYFVVIEFKHWNNKFPHGTIKFSLGSILNITNQYDVLFYYYPERHFIQSNKLKYTIDINFHLFNISNVLNVYSIDPIGCQDIDDALSFDDVNNNIGIHIADVIHTIDSLNYKQHNYSTIYAPHKNINMLSDEITYNYCSLIENTVKPVISCWINMNTFEVKLKREYIRIKRNYSYDDIETLNIPNVNVIMNFAIKLNNKYNLIDELTDSHQMIEVYMIFFNQYIANFLKNDKIIYRNQEPQKFAEYNFESKGHYLLKLKNYTHFTSPIRRFVDQYNHRVLINKLFKETHIPEVSIDDINLYEKQLKKINLYWNYIRISTKIVNASLYDLEFIQFDSNQIEFKLIDYNIIINNKLFFTIINNTTININSINYELNKVYNLPLYVINKFQFPKIMIKFI